MMQDDSLSVRAGKNLKRIIKEQGYTQEAFADEFGTDRANLRKWLSHGINKLSTIEQIAEFFDISVWDILKQGVFFLSCTIINSAFPALFQWLTIIQNIGVERKNKTMTPNKKYYKVTAKCGHVGRGNYVPINFAVRADSASSASQIAKRFPRVKKQLWDCIIACVEISKKEYKELLRINKNDPYLNCRCARDHSLILDEAERVVRMETQERSHRKVEPAKNMKYRKAIYKLGGRRNNLSLCYVED